MNKTADVNMTVTPQAETFIRRMLRFAPGTEAGFRLKITPGGCSGLAADFDLVAEPASNEIVWQYAGLRIFLDTKSSQLLNGATVDFVESRVHTGFVIATQGASQAVCSTTAPLVGIKALTRR